MCIYVYTYVYIELGKKNYYDGCGDRLVINYRGDHGCFVLLKFQSKVEMEERENRFPKHAAVQSFTCPATLESCRGREVVW